MTRDDVSYCEIYRFALGPGSPCLRGGNQVTIELARTNLYRIADDLATRAGVGQGLILAPEHEGKRNLALNIESPLSVPRAAEHIGISRIAAYKAIKEGRLGHMKVGNVLIVSLAEAERYKNARGQSSGSTRLSHRHSSAK